MEIIPIYAVLLLALYFLMLRPQRKRQQEAANLLNSLAVGDEIVLNSGIHGFINTLDDDIVWLAVSADLELKVARSAVAHRVVEGDDDASNDDDVDSDNDTDFIDSDS